MKINLINQDYFNSLSTLQKRVGICKDVLQRLDQKLIIPRTGRIFSHETVSNQLAGDREPKEFLNENSCQVCAKGAILCSWIGNFNNFSWKSIEALDTHYESFLNVIPSDLGDIFGREMLNKIECAFEGTWYPEWSGQAARGFEKMFPGIDVDSYDDFPEFLKVKAQNLEYRLRKIMGNIIRNEGEFVFEQF